MKLEEKDIMAMKNAAFNRNINKVLVCDALKLGPKSRAELIAYVCMSDYKLKLEPDFEEFLNELPFVSEENGIYNIKEGVK